MQDDRPVFPYTCKVETVRLVLDHSPGTIVFGKTSAVHADVRRYYRIARLADHLIHTNGESRTIAAWNSTRAPIPSD